MTTKDLSDLLARREAAWEELGRDERDLRDLPPRTRMAMERASAAYEQSDRAIVRELRRRGSPARAAGAELRLTKDRLHFAACDATGIPIEASRSSAWDYRFLLYRYPAPAGGRRT